MVEIISLSDDDAIVDEIACTEISQNQIILRENKIEKSRLLDELALNAAFLIQLIIFMMSMILRIIKDRFGKDDQCWLSQSLV